jgi:hypothetical protein
MEDPAMVGHRVGSLGQGKSEDPVQLISAPALTEPGIVSLRLLAETGCNDIWGQFWKGKEKGGRGAAPVEHTSFFPLIQCLHTAHHTPEGPSSRPTCATNGPESLRGQPGCGEGLEEAGGRRATSQCVQGTAGLGYPRHQPLGNGRLES